MHIAVPQPNARGTPIQRKAGFLYVTVQLCRAIKPLLLRGGLIINSYCSQNRCVLVLCRTSTCLSRAGGADVRSVVCSSSLLYTDVSCRWRGLSWILVVCRSGHGFLPLLGDPPHLHTISFAVAHLHSLKLASAAARRVSLTLWDKLSH